MADNVNDTKDKKTTVDNVNDIKDKKTTVDNGTPSNQDNGGNPDVDSLKKKQAELDAKERDINLKEYLAENNLPKEMFKELDGLDFEQSKKVISLINKHANDLAVEIADKRFKDNGFDLAPKDSVTTKSYGEMSIKERIALKEQNPELYANLLAAYRENVR